MVLVIGSTVALGRHYAWNQYQRMVMPDLHQILQEVNCVDSRHISMISSLAQKSKQEVRQEPDAEAQESELQSDVKDYFAGLPDIAADERLRASRRSHSDARYSEFIKNSDQNATAPALLPKPVLKRRVTGYAFSSDEDTTMNESILVAYAANRSPNAPQRLSHTIASWHQKVKGSKEK